MMDCSDFNVEDYRQAHESDNEWHLKKTFLNLHKDKFSVQRLLCLASCFLNIECYGNTYPRPVMEQIKQLSAEMIQELQEHRAAKTKFTEVKFVKASDEGNPGSSRFGSGSSTGRKRTMMFVKATDDYKSTDRDETKTDTQDAQSIFIQESEGHIKNSACQRYGLGAGPNSVKSAMKEFSKECQSRNDEEMLNKFYQLSNHLSEIRHKTDSNSVSVLYMACQKALMHPSVDFKSEAGTFVCDVKVDCVLVSVGHGTNKKTAKSDAFDKSLEKLGNPYLKLCENNSGNLMLDSSTAPFSNEPIVLSSDADNSATTDSDVVILGSSPPYKKPRKTSPSTSQSVPGSFDCGVVVSQAFESSDDEARLEQFQQLGTVLRKLKQSAINPSQNVHMAVQKCQMNLVVDYKQNGLAFVCEVKIDSVLVAQGTGASKKIAKSSAFEISAEVLTNPFLRITEHDSDLFVLESSHVPFANTFPSPVHRKQRKLPSAKPQQIPQFPSQSNAPREYPPQSQSSNFILMHPDVPEELLNAITVLQNSAAINRIPIEYEYFTLTNGVQCILYLGDKQVADVTAQGKQEAKQYAADMAFTKLKRTCWTIKTKQQADTNESSISKEEVAGDGNKINEALPDSNFGSKLMKKMGWAGGGIGKTGQGIAEPVSVSSVINRSGLGLQAEQGIPKDFLPRITTILLDYAKSMNFGDLTFTKEFSKEERALIHKESQKIGLKSHSHGKGDDRYLIVSRKMSAKEILKYVREKGGDTPKYTLVPPSS